MLLIAKNNKKVNFERLIQKQGKSASPGLLSEKIYFLEGAIYGICINI